MAQPAYARLQKAANELSVISIGLEDGSLSDEQALRKLARPKRRIAAAEALLTPDLDEDLLDRALAEDEDE